MIKEKNIDKNDIAALWGEAFGDSRKDILFFIDNVENAKCIAYYDSDKLAAMLYLVDCEINGKSAKYIYAACTALSCRNSGYMSKLLSFVKNNNDNICLIPAENWLIDYYKKRGFTEKTEINSIKFFEKEEIKEYLLEGCELENPFALLYKGD